MIDNDEIAYYSEVSAQIIIGNYASAKNKALLKELGITHILNAAKECANHFPGDFVYHNARISDSLSQDLYFYFDECSDFIEKSEKVLVHCVAGASRSCALVIAYLMRKENLSFQNAFDSVRTKHKICSPNRNFMSQLSFYEKKTVYK